MVRVRSFDRYDLGMVQLVWVIQHPGDPGALEDLQVMEAPKIEESYDRYANNFVFMYP